MGFVSPYIRPLEKWLPKLPPLSVYVHVPIGVISKSILIHRDVVRGGWVADGNSVLEIVGARRYVLFWRTGGL